MADEQLIVIEPNEKFPTAVKLRFALWETMIEEIVADQEIKRQVTEVLRKLRDEGLTCWDNLELAFASTIKNLDTVNETWKANTVQPSIQALFQNLKQDITDLQNELFNPTA